MAPGAGIAVGTKQRPLVYFERAGSHLREAAYFHCRASRGVIAAAERIFAGSLRERVLSSPRLRVGRRFARPKPGGGHTCVGKP